MSGLVLHRNVLESELRKLNYSYQTYRCRIQLSFSSPSFSLSSFCRENLFLVVDLLADKRFSAEHRWKIITEKLRIFKGARGGI